MKRPGKLPDFGELPDECSSYDRAAIVILPVPFDKTSTWGKGADRGPQAILEASMHMELYDIDTDAEAYRKGIFTAEPVNEPASAGMIEAVYARARKLIGENKFVVTLGGEHSVSIGSVRAHAEASKNLSILHLDAHTDRRETYKGSKYNHACVMARVAEICPTIVSVGIRSMDRSEKKKVRRDHLFLASAITRADDWIGQVIAQLTTDVYVTIDLDVFDPSIMPSTGTPEPGGLDWYQVTSLLNAVARRKHIRGFDVVELCPSELKAPDFLAAKLIYRLLSYVFCDPPPIDR